MRETSGHRWSIGRPPLTAAWSLRAGQVVQERTRVIGTPVMRREREYTLLAEGSTLRADRAPSARSHCLPSLPDVERCSPVPTAAQADAPGAGAGSPPRSPIEPEQPTAPATLEPVSGTSFGSGAGVIYPSGAPMASQAPAPASYPAPTHGLGGPGPQPNNAVQWTSAPVAAPASSRGGLRLRQMNAPPQVADNLACIRMTCGGVRDIGDSSW